MSEQIQQPDKSCENCGWNPKAPKGFDCKNGEVVCLWPDCDHKKTPAFRGWKPIQPVPDKPEIMPIVDQHNSETAFRDADKVRQRDADLAVLEAERAKWQAERKRIIAECKDCTLNKYKADIEALRKEAGE